MSGRQEGSPSVSVREFMKAAQEHAALTCVCGENGLDRRIPEAALNRPGLALSGFYRHFPHRRIQVLGMAEHAYLSSMSAEERCERLATFFARRVPCVIFTRNRRVFPEIHEMAERYRVPVLRSNEVTRLFVNSMTIIMENLIAPKMVMQGTMVEILGIGVLIEGAPGMGKSETALGLINRGHALVSDDVTAIRLDSTGSIIGSPVNVTRYHMEIRGLGIVHVPSLFGVASVREEKKLDMVASLVKAEQVEEFDRSGQTRPKWEILGVELPQVLIRVKSGRDLASLVETAALDYKLRRLGHDAAKELDEKLMSLLIAGRAGSE